MENVLDFYLYHSRFVMINLIVVKKVFNLNLDENND